MNTDECTEALARTPHVLRALLAGLAEELGRADEGPGSFSVRDVLAHLIQGEEENWIPRAEHILAHGAERPFVPFDRERRHGGEACLGPLLELFERRREESLARLRALRLAPTDLARPGLHPELGRVTLGQLLATWVVHDLAHLGQITRVLAKARASDIGPWRAYFRTLSDRIRP
jgi:uncharacterized damage-inducible protein DinB